MKKHFFLTRNFDQFVENENLSSIIRKVLDLQNTHFIEREEFQVWILKRKYKQNFILEMQDGNYQKIVIVSLILEDDVKINKVVFWYENDVLYFPNER